MDDNWAALCLAIVKNVPPEVAFYMLDSSTPVSDTSYSNIYSAKDTEDMMKLREMKCTYREIGEMYGIRDCTVYTRIKRYSDKLGKVVKD